MSSGRVAYHLRPNKAVDRHLFMDLLTKIHGYWPLSDYRYVGFGGPFLEDFRLIHSQFGIDDMTSIEMDKDVLKRQEFNLPLSCIDRRHTTSGQFITEYVGDRRAIIWLDYGSPEGLREEITEFEALLSKLDEGDIVKLTLNSKPEAIAVVHPPADGIWTREEFYEARLERLKELIGDYLPNVDDPNVMTAKRLPSLLYKAVEHAFLKAREVSPVKFEPLTSFFYNDAMHTMLTVTGILIKPELRDQFLEKTGIRAWPLGLPTAKTPVPINVPPLSTRERLFIDQLLPDSPASEIVTRLGFNCADEDDDSVEMIESYARFYRHYPYYSRVVP